MADLDAQLATFEAHMKSPRPQRAVLKAAGGVLVEILKSASGSAARRTIKQLPNILPKPMGTKASRAALLLGAAEAALVRLVKAVGESDRIRFREQVFGPIGETIMWICFPGRFVGQQARPWLHGYPRC